MTKRAGRLAAIWIIASGAFGLQSAAALERITYVSVNGADTGACATTAAACRSFQFAHNQTSAGGEIHALDPGSYFGLTITKSISIRGVDGAGVLRISGAAITINAGASDVVSLEGLTLDGINGAALMGISLNSGGQLTVKNCIVRNFQNIGISLTPTGATTFLIEDSIASKNGFHGIMLFPASGGSLDGAIHHVTSMKSTNGIRIVGPTKVTVSDSTISNNLGDGIIVESNISALRLAHSTVSRNASIGVEVLVNAFAESAGDNFIRGNGPSPGPANDVIGTLTNVGAR